MTFAKFVYLALAKFDYLTFQSAQILQVAVSRPPGAEST